jgi:hypothetical protein
MENPSAKVSSMIVSLIFKMRLSDYSGGLVEPSKGQLHIANCEAASVWFASFSYRLSANSSHSAERQGTSRWFRARRTYGERSVTHENCGKKIVYTIPAANILCRNANGLPVAF